MWAWCVLTENESRGWRVFAAIPRIVVVNCRFGSATLSVWWTQSISHVFPDIILLSSRVCHLFYVFVISQTLAFYSHYIRSININASKYFKRSFINIINQREKYSNFMNIFSRSKLWMQKVFWNILNNSSISANAVKWWIMEQIQKRDAIN